MPITALDKNTALVVIDLQRGIVALPAVHPIAEVVAQAGLLAQSFRRLGLPVVLVNVAGGAPGRAQVTRKLSDLPAGWSDLVPELQASASDHRVTKHTWGAFTHTGLEAYLRGKGVTQIVLAGMSTSIGVEGTARQAYELGFNVALALDAMTDTNADAHLHSSTRIFPRLGETGLTADIIALLEKAGA